MGVSNATLGTVAAAKEATDRLLRLESELVQVSVTVDAAETSFVAKAVEWELAAPLAARACRTVWAAVGVKIAPVLPLLIISTNHALALSVVMVREYVVPAISP